MDTYKQLSGRSRKRSKIIVEALLFNLPFLCLVVGCLVWEYRDHRAIGIYLFLVFNQIITVLQNGAEFAEAAGRGTLQKYLRRTINTGYLVGIGVVLFQIWWREGLKR